LVLTEIVMRSLVVSVVLVIAFAVLSGLAFIYSGVFDVAAASEPHWLVTRWVLETARLRSIQTHAAHITAPPGLDAQAQVLTGTAHFAAHCALCHGAPGVPKADLAKGLNPPPPDLADAAHRYSPGELFWILRHGIRMTGMPAWPDHSDEELWAIVAFLHKLPAMSEQDYAKLIMASMAPGGHHHSRDARGSPF
jgi:mono/diheme cytochrome c family protein